MTVKGVDIAKHLDVRGQPVGELARDPGQREPCEFEQPFDPFVGDNARRVAVEDAGEGVAGRGLFFQAQCRQRRAFHPFVPDSDVHAGVALLPGRSHRALEVERGGRARGAHRLRITGAGAEAVFLVRRVHAISVVFGGGEEVDHAQEFRE